jgi:hypothetical protein
MGEVINLRQARKTKARADAETSAAHNRAKFGRPNSEKHRTKAEQEAAARKLDGSKLDDDSNADE